MGSTDQIAHSTVHFDQWNPPNFKNLIIENIPPINRQESNMKITLLIKSGYNMGMLVRYVKARIQIQFLKGF